MASQPHRDHSDAVLLANREMAVVAWCRADERDWRAAAAPRLAAIARAGQKREYHGVVHQRQAGIVAGEKLFGWWAHDGREQAPRLDGALRAAVVIGAIGAVLGEAVRPAGDRGQQRMLIRLDRDLRYRFISEAYLAMTGRRPEQVVGKRLSDVLSDKDFQSIRPHVEKVLQ